MYRTATEDYRRQLIGAFAFTHHDLIRRWGKKLIITATDVDPRDAYHGFVGRGYYTPLRVDVSVPWGRDDPRGTDRQSMRTVFFRATPGGRIHSRLERAPCEVGTVVPLYLTPSELTYHAAIARWRLDRELDRGYALIRQEAPAPDHVGRERTLLPEYSTTHLTAGAIAARIVASVDGSRPGGDVILYEEVVDGELVDSFPTYDAMDRLVDAEWARSPRRVWEREQPVPQRPPFDYRERAAAPYTAIKLRGDLIGRAGFQPEDAPLPSFADRLARERHRMWGFPRLVNPNTVIDPTGTS